MGATHRITLPSREHREARLKERSARLAVLNDWRFWRRRPKVTLLTLQFGSLLAGSIVLLTLHWAPWVQLKTLRGHKGAVKTAAFSENGKLLISSGEDGSARIWDIQSGKEKLIV